MAHRIKVDPQLHTCVNTAYPNSAKDHIQGRGAISGFHLPYFPDRLYFELLIWGISRVSSFDLLERFS